jgi:hypothetical protein
MFLSSFAIDGLPGFLSVIVLVPTWHNYMIISLSNDGIK